MRKFLLIIGFLLVATGVAFIDIAVFVWAYRQSLHDFLCATGSIFIANAFVIWLAYGISSEHEENKHKDDNRYHG